MNDYRTKLVELLLTASPEVLAICRAWNDDHFGQPGWEGIRFIASEINRAKIAIKVLNGIKK